MFLPQSIAGSPKYSNVLSFPPPLHRNFVSLLVCRLRIGEIDIRRKYFPYPSRSPEVWRDRNASSGERKKPHPLSQMTRKEDGALHRALIPTSFSLIPGRGGAPLAL
jgi:hypothetical protein